MLEYSKFETLALDLLQLLNANKSKLTKLSVEATSNTTQDALIDLTRSCKFLEEFTSNTIPKMLKPKGKILLMLSYNEPLLLSIVPVFCAIATGNEVFIKPSSRNVTLFNTVWEKLITKHKLKMHILDIKLLDIEQEISRTQAVYFFGSHENAKKIYATCAKYYVEFHPEIEAADVRVFNNINVKDIDIKKDIATIIKNSFDHNGKTCQRICGVYLNNRIFSLYSTVLHSYLLENNYILSDVGSLTEKELFKDIKNSMPTQIYTNGHKTIVLNPSDDSKFIQKGYFNECLWLKSYKNKEELVNHLNNRIYHLGLNISSDDTQFSKFLIKNTNFSRYTLTDDHSDISKDTGWGGNWPTGSGGYQSWYEKFSNRYTIIS